ncbi:hypothetical protein DM860_002805 [Cuscuta australis]|uniref:Uncharacterized protein n=1 Tax=Cuscuta australis TaxID=267555 RepID=A0A328D0J7_9ASTE|nr:hypothetical protein DM860_002805 [Cuscuta australis]
MGAVMAAGIWAIWKARNQACWELKVVRPEVAADWAREVCVARTSRDLYGGTMVTSEGSGLQQLNRPDLVRCFVDAAMFEQDDSTSWRLPFLMGQARSLRASTSLSPVVLSLSTKSNLIKHTLARLVVNGCYEWHSAPLMMYCIYFDE